MSTTRPAPLLWTLDDYHRLIDSGLLDDRRVQLLDGQLIEMPPMNTPHIGAMHYLYRQFVRSIVGDRTFQQSPITIVSVNTSSEPEPDVYVAFPGVSLKPPIESIALIIEVSDATVRRDRAHKVALYTTAAAVEVWLVDLVGETVDVWRDGHFVHSFPRGQAIRLRPTHITSISIDVDAIFAASEQP